MYELIISEYIKKMNINDILSYAKKNGINLSECDAIILLSYAKKYYKDLLSGNDEKIIHELKDKLNPNTFKEAYKLYIEAKMKYLK